MSGLVREAGVAVRWSIAERVRALKRILPRAAIHSVLRKTGCSGTYCRRLPRWFMAWFVIAIALFCCDSYRQVFRWLHRYFPKRTPGRSTLCEARKSLGVAPLSALAEQVVELQGRPDHPHDFYAGMRLMAMDSFVVDVADTPRNEPRTGGLPSSACAQLV